MEVPNTPDTLEAHRVRMRMLLLPRRSRKRLVLVAQEIPMIPMILVMKAPAMKKLTMKAIPTRKAMRRTNLMMSLLVVMEEISKLAAEDYLLAASILLIIHTLKTNPLRT